MKIGVMSDTHDNSPAVVAIIHLLNERKIEVALHAGDIGNPGILRRFRDHYTGTLHFVFGNNDGEKSGMTQLAADAENLVCHNREMDIEMGGKKIFMNHYTYIAKAMAQTGEYDLCIGGHTHQYEVEEYGKTLYINPGNTVTKVKWQAYPKEETESSFVVLDLKDLSFEQVKLSA
jgi:uncharacterized protein